MTITEDIAIFWFRRDLRLHDNHGLFKALSGQHKVLPLFIFDTEILNALDDKADQRVEFIHQCLTDLKNGLESSGGGLLVKHGPPEVIWKDLVERFPIKAVYTNHDYEPYAQQRDKALKGFFEGRGISFQTFKDQVIFEKDEVLSNSGTPYTVFTPYSKKWKALLAEQGVPSYPSQDLLKQLYKLPPIPFPGLKDIGFLPSGKPIPSPDLSKGLIRSYEETRNFPSVRGTSRASIHLRFGTLSIRDLVRNGLQHSETWLNELIWREFYMSILWHFPHVVEGAFRPKYDHIQWRNNESEFKAWCEGKTGYPIVDAGMRELNETGFMHNRVRMITASFLVKHLLIDWRWGEAYFAKKLLDFELASNNGGWQWAAGTGTDAAPYFRIFNPESQMKKFDPKGKYVLQWVPEFGTPAYPKPIVDHKMARQRCLDTYKRSLEMVEA